MGQGKYTPLTPQLPAYTDLSRSERLALTMLRRDIIQSQKNLFLVVHEPICEVISLVILGSN